MDLGLRDKVAVVLAASKGMGFAVARALAGEGCRLAICARGKGDLERAARQIEAETTQSVLRMPVDVGRPADRSRFLGAVKRKLGTPDILVVNGGGPPPGSPLELADEDWEAAWRSTLKSAIDWMRACAPAMARQRWGRILAIESTSIKEPIDGLALSNTMRAGVAGFCKSLAREVAPHNVTVNVVCPGRILTDRLRSLAGTRAKKQGGTEDEVLRKMAEEVPAGRLGTPDDFAAAALFLASEPAKYVTGQVISVDGGVTRGLY